MPSSFHLSSKTWVNGSTLNEKRVLDDLKDWLDEQHPEILEGFERRGDGTKVYELKLDLLNKTKR